jgi:hypothetical protein
MNNKIAFGLGLLGVIAGGTAIVMDVINHKKATATMAEVPADGVVEMDAVAEEEVCDCCVVED